MPRLTPTEASALYDEGARPSEILEYNPVEHEEEMKDLMTGLVGLAYVRKLPAVHSFEIGHRLPALVLQSPLMRMYISPEFDKVTPRRITFGAFTYQGDWAYYDTEKMWLRDTEVLLPELRRIVGIARSLVIGDSARDPDLITAAGHVLNTSDTPAPVS